MNWQYTYTPYLWPMLATAMFVSVLAVYAWRHRRVPGALPLAITMLFGVLWAVGAALELAAVDIPTKIFWYKSIIAVCLMPLAIARFCFVLDYAGLGRLLTRRNLVLLSIPPLLQFLLVLTNDSLHGMWLEIEFDGTIRPSFGIGGWIVTGFGYLLFPVNLVIFARLFFRSPSHRWPVVLILCSMLITHTSYLLDFLHLNPFAPLSSVVVSMNISFIIYVLALFRFHMFDPIPAARKAVIERMEDGMLVLDTDGLIADLNPAAQSLFDAPRKAAIGRQAREVLRGVPALQRLLDDSSVTHTEIQAGTESRWYEARLSPLIDPRGLHLGQLLLLHDVTEQKQAQAQLLEQQRALAALQERERVARELHDGLGQVLGYVKMQAQAARERLAHDEKEVADDDLAQLIAVAQDAHADVREYILGARSGTSIEPGLLPALRQYLQRFSETYKIRTELVPPSEGTDGVFEPTVEAQLLRIIQEALTNARKHARAGSVQVRFSFDEDRAQIIVEDDGAGFDPALLATAEGQKFGLGFMRERAEEVGGRVEIQSAPGAGTRVVIDVPTKKDAVKERHGDAVTRRMRDG